MKGHVLDARDVDGQVQGAGDAVIKKAGQWKVMSLVYVILM